MTPRLPPELLAQILTCAQEGKHPLERQKIRNTFRSVCREWYLSFDHWREVCTTGAKEIETVTGLLSALPLSGGSAAGMRVKSVYVGLLEREAKARGSKVATKLIGLLKVVKNTQWVELQVGYQGLLRGEFLGKAVCKALAKLKQVEHFTISPTIRGYTPNHPLPISQLAG